jgi:hypothetical protein
MKAIVFVVMLSAVAQVQSGRAQSEVHLIPDGYVGWVAVAFGAANGEAPMYDGDSRLYRIPKSGVLLTQAEPNRGVSPAWKFFIEGADGTRTLIRLVRAGPVSGAPDSKADPTIGIFGISHGRTPAGAARCQVEFDMYFVGTQAQSLHNFSGRFQRLGQALMTQYICP